MNIEERRLPATEEKPTTRYTPTPQEQQTNTDFLSSEGISLDSNRRIGSLLTTHLQVKGLNLKLSTNTHTKLQQKTWQKRR